MYLLQRWAVAVIPKLRGKVWLMRSAAFVDLWLRLYLLAVNVTWLSSQQ